MTRYQQVTYCLDSACRGNPKPLSMMLHFLILGCRIPPDRLVDIADRCFGVPTQAAWGALYELTPEAIQ